METTAITDLETAQARIIQLEKELATKTNELHQQKEELEYTNSLLDEVMGELEQSHSEILLLKKSQPMSNDNMNQVVNQDTQSQLHQALELLEKYQQQLDKTMAVVEKLSLKSTNNQTTTAIQSNTTHETAIKRVYIRGCPRSGNTLILYLCSVGFANSHILTHQCIPTIANSDPHKITFATLPSPEASPEKQLQAKNFLEQSDTAIIFMVRDPRDVLVSEHGQKPGEPWIQNPQKWINNALILEKLQSHPRVIVIKYEDLVSKPNQVQKEIAEKLGLTINIPFQKGWQHFQLTSHAIKSLNGLRQLETSRIGNWSSNPEKKQYVNTQLEKYSEIRKLMKKFGYFPEIDILTQQQYYRKKIKALVKNNPNQLSVAEYELIVNAIISKLPCNFLVFGVGKDSSLWLELNSQGKTIFIEDNQEWINKVKQSLPDMQVYHVDYATKLPEWKKLLECYEEGEKDCLSMSLPDEIYQTNWDVIFVDAPAGFGQKPGRMKSIYLASQLAIKSKEIDIFVHDCNRQVEDVYTKYFLGQENLVTEISKLRYFHIKSDNDTLDNSLEQTNREKISPSQKKISNNGEEIHPMINNHSSRHNSLIAGVSMVKDEEDIIYYTLEGNYKQGVDKFVILDNLSSDQTVPEIKRFMKDYPDCMIYLIEDQDVQFHKFRKMSALAEFAYRLWDVEWIFPFDADEVIDSASDLLSNVLTTIDQKHLCLRLGHKNYILRDFYDYSEPNPLKRITYRVKKSPPSKADKVMVRWQPGMIILQGHHFIELAGKRLQPTFLGDKVGISLRHYRFRSLQQLKNKILNGGLAYQSTPDLSEKIGLNWRELYKEYLKKGEIYFDELYQSFLNKPQERLVFDPAFTEKDNLNIENINELMIVNKEVSQIRGE